MPERPPTLVFVLGSFRDIDARRRRSRRRLARLVVALRARGHDAFLSGDVRSLELAGNGLTPREMTGALDARCDLAFYVASGKGRGDGWVSELVAMQPLRPAGASKRVLLIQSGYPLSRMLDPEMGGYLASPPVKIVPWSNERELRERALRYAAHMRRYGCLPGR